MLFLGSGIAAAQRIARHNSELEKLWIELSGLQQLGCGPDCVSPEEQEKEYEKFKAKVAQFIYDLLDDLGVELIEII